MPDPKKVFVKVPKSTKPENEEAKSEIDPPVKKNRNPVVTTTVKGKDKKGSYTETINTQDEDVYKGTPASERPKHTSNTWYNNLTQAQKDAHNKEVKERESKIQVEATPETKVAGENSTNRVYDPVPEKKQVSEWDHTKVDSNFGGVEGWGIANSQAAIDHGERKNAIDHSLGNHIAPGSNPAGNVYEHQPLTENEERILANGRYGNQRFNPYQESWKDKKEEEAGSGEKRRQGLIQEIIGKMDSNEAKNKEIIASRTAKHEVLVTERDKRLTQEKAVRDANVAKIKADRDARIAKLEKKPTIIINKPTDTPNNSGSTPPSISLDDIKNGLVKSKSSDSKPAEPSVPDTKDADKKVASVK